MAIFFQVGFFSQYRNVSILDFIGPKGDGGGSDHQSYKTCKVPVKSSPPTNQHPVLVWYGILGFNVPLDTPSIVQAGCRSCRPVNGVKALKVKEGKGPYT